DALPIFAELDAVRLFQARKPIDADDELLRAAQREIARMLLELGDLRYAKLLGVRAAHRERVRVVDTDRVEPVGIPVLDVRVPDVLVDDVLGFFGGRA